MYTLKTKQIDFEFLKKLIFMTNKNVESESPKDRFVLDKDSFLMSTDC